MGAKGAELGTMGAAAEIEAAKAAVRAHEAAIEEAAIGDAETVGAGVDGIAEALSVRCAPGWSYRGTHPFGSHQGPEAVARAVWAPLLAALGPVQRRPDILFAGLNDMEEGGAWACSMGHLIGNLDAPLLGLGPTGRLAFLRYCDWHRVEGERIVETVQFLDLMNLMAQLGSPALPTATGVVTVTPGPRTHDGLRHAASHPAEGRASLALVRRMVERLRASGIRTTRADLEADWREDMLWWGPGGIGASFTQSRYLRQHCGPFEDGLDFVRSEGHEVEIGEAAYAGFFGWPSLAMRPTGGYLGLSGASGREGEMRIVDLYRVEDGRLAENWVFIDHLHFLHQLGVDLLARHAALTGGR